ncbi:CBF-domain-containing protein [Dacryopinax primogenitus]|uniref:CBF-domain-containing protein n=1 Tax=Dacryopinax primogenitus (strain DJM 731) TaxID=1858805 RepID=M5FR29_DACPD|nr:CBF-domain-containing protein [Dacryopinax primogenitus]EJT98063.1 CBF-domain-containing protein [Dacryopinax primogenitus]
MKVSKCIMAPIPHWYDIDLPSLERNDNLPFLSVDDITARVSHASGLHEAEVEAYTSSGTGASIVGMSGSDAIFLSRILSSGTLSDRLSALTLMAQSSPLHNTRALNAMKSMAGKKSREESLKAIRAITDWWVGGGAPSRKLKYIRDQPLNHPDVTDRHLLIWYFEDWVKKYFFSILQLLEGLLLDPLPFIRMQAMTLVAQLLKEKPEQEQNLLRLLVNKLGDLERTVASKASFHLLQLLQSHPAMKSVVIRDVSSLILRPPSTSANAKGSENQHAKYYGVITFNQTTLTKSDLEVSRALIEVYFDLFREIIGKADEPVGKSDKVAPKKRAKGKGRVKAAAPAEEQDENSKMIAAILTGINRSLPFANLDQAALNTHVDLLFRITHSATFNISVQSLMLVFHVMADNKGIVDRFYRTLYESLFDPRLLTASKQILYLNLLFKALKADPSFDRQIAFVKRIFQTLTLHQPPFICGAIYLMGELFTNKPDLRALLRTGSILEGASEEADPRTAYDPRKRDPLYAHASSSQLWEVSPLLHHFHPSVSLHARQLTADQQITATADLGLNTIIHFLDRFVYRNPKKPRPKGTSAMQPSVSGLERPGIVRLTRGYQGDAGTVNNPSFWSQKAAYIPVDKLFFHQYFAQRSGRHQAKVDKVSKRKKGHKDSESQASSREDSEGEHMVTEGEMDADQTDAGSEESEDEAEVWKAMKASMPKFEDVDDDMDSADIEDMEDDMRDISDLSPDDSDDAFENDLEDDDAAVPEPYDTDDGANEDDADDFYQFDEEDLVDMDDEVDELPTGEKRKVSGGHGMGKRRKLRQLPTFATYEDYKEMIEGAPEENI